MLEFQRPINQHTAAPLGCHPAATQVQAQEAVEACWRGSGAHQPMTYEPHVRNAVP